MYRIGLFSKINKVSIKALRYYDEVGLLKPAFVDEENGYRYYTSEQLPQIHQIIALRQMGFSIDEITSVLRGNHVTGIFEQRKAELVASLEESKMQMRQIEYYLSCMDGALPVQQVAMKELPEVLVYSKRFILPCYDEYFKCLPDLGERVTRDNPGIACSIPEYCFSIYHDGEYRERDIDTEFCEAVTFRGKDTDEVKFKVIKRVPQAACVYHKGPYSTLGNSYAYLFKWIADNGYTPSEPPRESYIDGIWNKESAEWLTEIQVPVIRK